MPAGKYYVGDLCYVMHEEWDEVCGLFFAGRNDHGCNEGEFQLKDGRRFVSYNTKWGDGGYRDQYGKEYSVDAGLIGCIRMDDISDGERDHVDGGHVVVFTHDFECSGGRNGRTHGEWDGVIRIGHLEINTDPSGDEYYDEDEY